MPQLCCGYYNLVSSSLQAFSQTTNAMPSESSQYKKVSQVTLAKTFGSCYLNLIKKSELQELPTVLISYHVVFTLCSH